MRSRQIHRDLAARLREEEKSCLAPPENSAKNNGAKAVPGASGKSSIAPNGTESAMARAEIQL
eukprot:2963090-Pleurochrysis_carterae.AAC.1